MGGLPFDGGTVYAYPLCDCSGYDATVSATGIYSLSLPAGTYDFRFTPTGWVTSSLSIASGQVIAGGAVVTLNGTFAVAKIEGRITDMLNVGLPGVIAYAYDLSSAIKGYAVTDTMGSYKIVVPPGTYRVRTLIPSWGTPGDKWWNGASGAASFATATDVDASANAAGVDQSYPANRISGTLRDSAGSPLVTSVAVYAETTACTGVNAASTTAVNGAYTLLVPDGTVRVRVQFYSLTSKRYHATAGSVTDCASASDIVTSGSATVTGKDITLPVFVLSGTITGATSGSPVPDATVYPCFSWGCVAVSTDAAGVYATNVEAGTATSFTVYPPTARWEYLSNSGGFTVSGDTVQNAALAERYLISGTVRRTSDSSVVPFAYVQANNTSCAYVAGDTTDVNGYFEIYVPSGTYRVEYEADELATRWTGNASTCAAATNLVIGTSDPPAQDMSLPQGAITADQYNVLGPLGLRLQRQFTFVFPRTASAKTMTLTSSNSAVIPDQTFVVGSGFSSVDIFIKGGTTAGTATLTLSMPGYTSYTFSLTTVQPELRFDGPTELAWSSAGPTSGPSSVRWELYTPGCDSTGTCDEFAADTPVTVTIESRAPDAIVPGPYGLAATGWVGSSSTSDVTIPAPTTVGTFDVRASAPGFSDLVVTITVVTPRLTLSDTVVAAGFTRSLNFRGVPSTSACPTITVTNGTGSITMTNNVSCGTSLWLNGLAVGTATVQLDLPGYEPAIATITVETPTFYMLSSLAACPNGGRCDGTATVSVGTPLVFSVGAKTSIGWTDFAPSGPAITFTVISGPASFTAPTTGSSTTVSYPRALSQYQSNDATLAFSGTGTVIVRASATGFADRDFTITVGP